MEKEKHSYPCGGRGPRMAGRIARRIVMGLVLALVFGLFVRLLWNWLMPGVFSLREITYWQAIGLVVLSHILFGHKAMHPGMRPGRHGHGPWAWHGPCSGGGDPNGDIKDWRRYDEWWEAEGREAYKKYINSHAS